jgi:hypothetical protein
MTVPFDTPWETITANMGRGTVLRECPTVHGNCCRLIERSPGYYPAGSWVTYQEHSYGVKTYLRDGTEGGIFFNGPDALEKAKAEFFRRTEKRA